MHLRMGIALAVVSLLLSSCSIPPGAPEATLRNVLRRHASAIEAQAEAGILNDVDSVGIVFPAARRDEIAACILRENANDRAFVEHLALVERVATDPQAVDKLTAAEVQAAEEAYDKLLTTLSRCVDVVVPIGEIRAEATRLTSRSQAIADRARGEEDARRAAQNMSVFRNNIDGHWYFFLRRNSGNFLFTGVITISRQADADYRCRYVGFYSESAAFTAQTPEDFPCTVVLDPASPGATVQVDTDQPHPLTFQLRLGDAAVGGMNPMRLYAIVNLPGEGRSVQLCAIQSEEPPSEIVSGCTT